MKKVLAFDIGGTNTRLALINEELAIEKMVIKPTVLDTKEGFMNNVLNMIGEFDLKDVSAIGAGVPGVVNPKTGYIYDLPNVHIKDIDFGKIIKDKYNKDVFLRNDAEVACLAEACAGAGKDYSRVFFITISTGLGGALCVDGQIQDYVTEVGHTLFLYKNKLQEYSLASGSQICNLSQLNNTNFKNAIELFDSYKKGDENAQKVFDEWLNILQKFIRLMIDSYSPEIIVFTGGLMDQKDLFFKQIKDKNSDVVIEECMHKTKAGLVGSAVYALNSLKNNKLDS